MFIKNNIFKLHDNQEMKDRDVLWKQRRGNENLLYIFSGFSVL